MRHSPPAPASAVALSSRSRRPNRIVPSRELQLHLPLSHEDPDALLTGTTRSLTRRLFALSLQPHPTQPLSVAAVPKPPLRRLA